MVRVYTKTGDVFSVKIDETHKKYFQLIAYDLTQLNSDVIHAFKRVYPADLSPALSEIVEGEVEFYAHCVTRAGVKLGLWEKVGSNKNVGDINHILFRGTSDCGKRIDGELVKISSDWYIWHINDRNFTDVGKLKGENRKAEIGVVVNPYDIVDRITTGKYNFFYPGFE
ncbi:hypothetical protein [Bacteroides nordii]|uniref:hypothetical protein n=1 Tax=Bacteroides nordii TaxID=291645 RepID=UPI00399A6FD0